MEGTEIAKGPGSIGTGLIGGLEPSLGRGPGTHIRNRRGCSRVEGAAGRKKRLETQQRTVLYGERQGSNGECEDTPLIIIIAISVVLITDIVIVTVTSI